MNDIVFKVAKPGEGKTKWLLTLSKQFHDEGKQVFLIAKDDTEYVKFCEKYFNMYHEICYTQKLTAVKDTKNAVILVDNLLKHEFNANDLYKMNIDCFKMFVTLEGTTEFNITDNNDYYQQSFDFEEVAIA